MELARVLASRSFRRADRISQFLTFLVERSLAGDVDRLKETALGVELFGRSPGYDTQTDPIVRVTARRLRARLRNYYAQEARDAGMRIELTAGGYVPAFSAREQGTPSTLTARDSGDEFVVRCAAGRPSHPAFSPDGDALAFELRSTADGHAGVYVQHLDADSAARLGAAGTREGRPVWSPDGGRIALAREVAPGRFEIHTVPALGFGDRSIAVIENAPGAPPRLDWSPDGRFLLTAERSSPESASYLAFVSLDLGELWRFATPPPGAAECDEAAFSLDGDMVAFRCRFSAGVEDVYVLPLAGRREARRLTFDECPVSGLAWCADGESLIVSSTRQGDAAGLWKVSLSGGEPLRLTGPNETALWPSVCRHSQRIAYVRTTGQSGRPHTEIVLKNPRIDGTFPTFPVSGL